MRRVFVVLFWLAVLFGSNALGPFWNWLAVAAFCIYAFRKLRARSHRDAALREQARLEQQLAEFEAAQERAFRRWHRERTLARAAAEGDPTVPGRIVVTEVTPQPATGRRWR